MLNIRPINEELRKVAREELNEVESRMAQDIAILREWLEKQPHLRAPSDDQFLVSYLRGCKYSIEKAKSKIDYCFTLISMAPEVFCNNTMNAKNLEICRSGCFVRLPQPLGAGGPRIHLINFSKLNAKKHNLSDLFRYQCMASELHFHLDDDNCIIGGLIEIFDFTNTHLSLLLQFDPILVKKLAVFSEKASAARIKGVHLINMPTEARVILNLCKSVMSEKTRQRVIAHASLEDLYKVIPQKYLPIEYGGSNGSIPEIQAETERQFLQHHDKLLQNGDYGVDEKLRPGQKLDKITLFGTDGSFRQLNVD